MKATRMRRGWLMLRRVGLLGCFLALPCGQARAEWLVDGNPVSEAPNPKGNPAILPSGSDAVIVAWADDHMYNGAMDIYATRILLSGERDPRWPAMGLPVCDAPGLQFSPRLVGDGQGGAIVLWVDFRDGSYGVFAHRLMVSGSIAPGWPSNGLRLCSSVGGIVEAVSDEQGGAIAIWRDAQSSSHDVRAQRVSASGSVSPGWPANGVVIGEGISEPNVRVSVVPDGQGGAIATWYTLNDPIDIYAQRVSSSGAIPAGWPSGGARVCDATGGQFNPVAASNGVGGALIAWSDLRTGDEDIYLAHVLADGSMDPGWPANGTLVCAAPNVQQNPRIASDGAGGCFVAWMDFRDAVDYDLYAQRIGPDGLTSAGWQHNGEPVCTAVAHQHEVAAMNDGAGGLIMAWQDARSDPGDVYVQRLTPDGQTSEGWSQGGVPVTGPPDTQAGAVLTSDGRQGAILSYGDYRSSVNDVFVQRISSSAVLGPDIPAEPGAIHLELLTPKPNPLRGTSYLTVRLPAAAILSVEILDPAGRRVVRLQDKALFPAGDHTFSWSGDDQKGNAVAPGIYLVQASAGDERAACKIVKF